VNKRDLRRAAAILRREARAIKAGRAVGRKQWAESPDTVEYQYMLIDKYNHDEMLDLAAKLETCAKTGGFYTRLPDVKRK
jgi:hypothetical protein